MADALVNYHNTDGSLIGTQRTDAQGFASIDQAPEDGFVGFEISK